MLKRGVKLSAFWKRGKKKEGEDKKKGENERGEESEKEKKIPLPPTPPAPIPLPTSASTSSPVAPASPLPLPPKPPKLSEFSESLPKLRRGESEEIKKSKERNENGKEEREREEGVRFGQKIHHPTHEIEKPIGKKTKETGSMPLTPPPKPVFPKEAKLTPPKSQPLQSHPKKPQLKPTIEPRSIRPSEIPSKPETRILKTKEKFVSSLNFEKILFDVDASLESLERSTMNFSNLEELNSEQEKKSGDFHTVLEDAQRKLLLIEKMVFEKSKR